MQVTQPSIYLNEVQIGCMFVKMAQEDLSHNRIAFRVHLLHMLAVADFILPPVLSLVEALAVCTASSKSTMSLLPFAFHIMLQCSLNLPSIINGLHGCLQ